MPAIDVWDFVNPPTFEGLPPPPRSRNNIAAVQDGARITHPDPTKRKAVASAVKFCLACPHWAHLHPGHGPCAGQIRRMAKMDPCTCAGFVDPEPGRPDRVFTREQVDKMPANRWIAIKARVYLMKDGRYGVLDEWTDKDKYFRS